MSLTRDDFKYPAGELVVDFFPATLDADLDVWISQAATLTDDEVKQQAYVYYRAYDYLVTMQVKEDAKRDLGPASYSRYESQFAEFPKRRDYWRSKFEAGDEIVESEEAVSSSPPIITVL
jgi:hypothetical protein